MPFQLESVKQIYAFGGRALLAHEMGLGKTIQALYWITKIPKRRPVIIVAPASMKYTWQSEAALHFGIRTEVLEGRANGTIPHRPGDIIILNYDILRSWLPTLLAWQPRCVILDEIHFIKNLRALRTKAALRLVQRVPSVVGLSGTPLTNRPIELWSVLKAIRPDLFPSREKFAWRYCKPRYTPWGWLYDGATRLPELRRILRETCMIRRLKKDVLPELPPKSRHVVSFRLKSYKEYNKAQHDFINWLKAFSPVRARRAARSKALTKVGYLLRLVARLKLEWTQRWIEEFFIANPGQKLVALTMHTFVIDALKAHFGASAVVIDGRVTGRRRQETVHLFQSNRKINLLLGNWIAAGVGITLTAAHNAVALDLPWTPGDLIQGEDRIHRIGQKDSVTVHYLTVLDTIEERQTRILQRKSKILDAVLDGNGRARDLNMFDELLKEMRQS